MAGSYKHVDSDAPGAFVLLPHELWTGLLFAFALGLMFGGCIAAVWTMLGFD